MAVVDGVKWQTGNDGGGQKRTVIERLFQRRKLKSTLWARVACNVVSRSCNAGDDNYDGSLDLAFNLQLTRSSDVSS